MNGLDELGLGEAALALTRGEVGGDVVGQAQGAEDAGSGERAGVRAGGLRQGAGVEHEGGFGQERQAGGQADCKIVKPVGGRATGV